MREAIRDVNDIYEWDSEIGFYKKEQKKPFEAPYMFEQPEFNGAYQESVEEFNLQCKLMKETINELVEKRYV
jgi:hypothetical protein